MKQTLEETKAEAYGAEEPARIFEGEADYFENFARGEEYFYLYMGARGWLYSQGGNWSCIKTEQEVA